MSIAESLTLWVHYWKRSTKCLAMFPTITVVIVLIACVTVQCFQRISSSKSNRILISKLSAIPAPLSNPPTTFLKCVQQAVVGAKKALAIGENLLEVEFPPLPLEYLDDSSSSARDVSDANTRWAIEFAKGFTDTLGQVTVLYPDDAELQDAIKYVDMEGGDTPFPNIKMATARADSIKNAKSIDQVILSIFGATSKSKSLYFPSAFISYSTYHELRFLPPFILQLLAQLSLSLEQKCTSLSFLVHRSFLISKSSTNLTPVFLSFFLTSVSMSW